MVWKRKKITRSESCCVLASTALVTFLAYYYCRPTNIRCTRSLVIMDIRRWQSLGLGSHQSPVPSYQGDYVCSDISHELINHKIIPVPFRQPSTVFQPTGAAGEADHVEPGSVPTSLTCNRPTLASTRRGFAHKIVPNGVQLWRRLCSPLGVPPDDDDESLGGHY